MKASLVPALLLAGSYLLGSVSFATLLVSLARGVDVRGLGSGNAGATNVLRTAGHRLGLAVLLLDVVKGVFPVAAMRVVTPDPRWAAAAALAAVVGHVLPCWFAFRGGKGVATAVGAFGTLSPWAGLAAAGVFLVVVAATRLVSAGSLSAVVAFVLTLRFVLGAEDATVFASAALTVLLFVTHRHNLVRLARGTELRLGGKDRART